MPPPTPSKPMAIFSKAGGGHNWHIRLLRAGGALRVALCGYEPTSRKYTREKGHWTSETTERPYFLWICPRCAKKACLSRDSSPDDATICYGEVVKAALRKA